MLLKFNAGKLRRGVLFSLLAVLAVPAARLPASAAISQTFNYQGFLLSKTTNLPVDGTQAIRFVIYNSASGGASLFTETRCPIAVNKGRYDVEIGSVTAGGIPDSLFLNNQNLWLEIQVSPANCSSPSYEAMSPRMRLQASPYAFNSLYASTASAATVNFMADTINALPQTTYGAITISTNLFVQGGISVGSISPGQKLAVAGVVESTGTYPACANPANYTCGFKFPDGSVQVRAAAVTMWEVSGPNVYSINPGNVGIGETLTSPLARLHVSSAAGDTGDLFLVTAGAVEKFRVNGLGQVHGGEYYGNGANLAGVVRLTGDVMTGYLKLQGSSMTVTSPFGVEAPKLKLAANVELSSASAAQKGGIFISSNVYLPVGAVYYGDGGGLTNLFTYDNSKIWRTGDTMAGSLTIGYSTITMSASTLTVTGNAFSVTGSTFAVFGGSVAIGSLTSFPTRLYVVGGINATSSITAQAGLYSNTFVNAANANFTASLTASSGTFTANGEVQYSIETSSGIKVSAGSLAAVEAPYFIGNGTLLTGVLKSTDVTKVSKFGDTMTGNLQVLGSSLTITTYGAHQYALTVGSITPTHDYYDFVVTNAGDVGVHLNTPGAPLDVLRKARVSYDAASGEAELDLYSNGNPGYISWRDYSLATGAGEPQGALGVFNRDLIYRANGTNPAGGAGEEVFRIKADDASYWKFGIGTIDPQERFHVGTSVLVSTRTTAYPGTIPVFFASTTTSKVSISTTSQTHSLSVGGGLITGSSITARAGIFGESLQGSTITAPEGRFYDGVVFTTAVFVNSSLGVGGIFNPAAALHVRGGLRLDQKADEDMVINFYTDFGGDSYLTWGDFTLGSKGALGIKSSDRDLIYMAGDSDLNDDVNSVQAFRIKPDGKFLMGEAAPGFAATERFQVMTNLMVGNGDAGTSILYVSTGLSSVGFSTGTPKERVHVASSFLVGDDPASAILFVSTATDSTGIGTANPRALLDVNGNILGSGAYTGTAVPPVSGGSTARLLWVPSAAALRAGGVADQEWNAANIGSYSIGLGYNPKASANYSAALGGTNNTVVTQKSIVAGGENNLVSGLSSAILGGGYNTVHSSYSFAGGYNNYLDVNSSGTFVWSYDDAFNAGFNGLHITTPFSFLIDPADTKHYTVGIRTATPQAALDVNGDAKFGATATKTSFTSAGFWVPRSMTQAEFIAVADPPAGAMAYSSTLNDICFFNGTTWVTVGAKATCE